MQNTSYYDSIQHMNKISRQNKIQHTARNRTYIGLAALIKERVDRRQKIQDRKYKMKYNIYGKHKIQRQCRREFFIGHGWQKWRAVKWESLENIQDAMQQGGCGSCGRDQWELERRLMGASTKYSCPDSQIRNIPSHFRLQNVSSINHLSWGRQRIQHILYQILSE